MSAFRGLDRLGLISPHLLIVGIVIQGAQVVVPKGPGFGVELDAKIVERHRLDR